MKKQIFLLFLLTALGFFTINSLVVTVPSTIDDFFLPGSQPGESGTLEKPSKCDNCHGGYDEALEPAYLWSGSMMAQAARDPIFWAAVAIAEQDVPFSGDLCIRCHTPRGWLGGRSEPTNGSALTVEDRNGISCDFCHKSIKPSPVGVNPYPSDPIYTADTYPEDSTYLAGINDIPDTSANGMYVVDDGNEKRGPFHDVNANHQFLYSPFHQTSAICGTCHDVSNPAISAIKDGNGNIIDYEPNAWGTPAPDFDPHSMMPVERTFSEWAMSDYNSPTGVPSTVFGGNLTSVSSCQDCHMRDTTGVGCNKNPPVRNDLPLHDFTGGNTFAPLLIEGTFPGEADQDALAASIPRAEYMLQHAATMTIETVDTINQEATIKVINETGHKLPSGYPEGRRIWVNIKAWSEDGEFYESAPYDTGTALLTHDPDAKIYEVKPGISPALAGALGVPSGPSFHFVLSDTIFSDNRIPPRGFTNANFEAIQSAPIGYTYADGEYWDNSIYNFNFNGQVIALEVSLFYQTISLEYVSFLKNENTTNTMGDLLYDLWEANGKSPPELMQFNHWGAPVIDEDGDGFLLAVDCDDNDPDINPGTIELFDCIDNNCDGITDEPFNSETFIAWTGCHGNSDWNEEENWNFGRTPNSEDHVIIPGTVLSGLFPIVDESIQIKSVTIESGAILTMLVGSELTINPITTTNDAALIIEGEMTNEGALNIDNSSTDGINVMSGGIFTNIGICTVQNITGNGLVNDGNVIIETTGQLNLSNIGLVPVKNQPFSLLTIRGNVQASD
jgi:hypothetical protein